MEPALEHIKNSTVFARVDFDVPISKDGVSSIYRITRCTDTIKTLIQGNNKIVLFTKIGRPEKKSKELSTINLLPSLKQIFDEVFFVRNIDELQGALKIDSAKLILYENTRFFNWEKQSEPTEKVKRLASFFDYYVDEAFAMSHRTEPSNYLIPTLVKKVAIGLNYKNELRYLNIVKVGQIKNPSLFILGGAKPETKIPMIKTLAPKFTYFLVGGKLAGDKSILEISKTHQNVIPMKLTEDGFDINQKSADTLARAIKLAKTTVWNGPVGMFEKKEHSHGTRKLISAIESKKDTLTLAGGGDTIAAIEKYGSTNNYTFISTGGGAMFSYLANNQTNIDKIKDKIKD